MNSNVIKGLVGFCLLLILVIAAEWLLIEPSEQIAVNPVIEEDNQLTQ